MKIKVKDIEFNPFRNIEKYPVDKLKLEALKNSIEETGFWDNILARPKPDEQDKYQIAYGHHRLIIIRELGIKEIDIPVKELSDSDMLRIMANENKNDWDMSNAIRLETVRATRDFLNAELGRYETWEDVEKYPNNFIKVLFANTKGDWKKAKDQGVGQTTILKFLGRNWKQHEIQDALDTLESKDIDSKAIEILGSTYASREFKSAVRAINKEKPGSIPKEKQVKLAKKIKDKIDNRKISKRKDNYSSSLKNLILQEVDESDEFDATLKELILEIKNITKDSEHLSSKIGSLNGKLDSMGVQDLKSIHSIFVLNGFSQLFINTSTFLDYLGFKFNQLQIEEK